jgi:hypothetical protein
MNKQIEDWKKELINNQIRHWSEHVNTEFSVGYTVRHEIVRKYMLILLFWVVTLCGLLGRYQCLGETNYLHLQGCCVHMAP